MIVNGVSCNAATTNSACGTVDVRVPVQNLLSARTDSPDCQTGIEQCEVINRYNWNAECGKEEFSLSRDADRFVTLTSLSERAGRSKSINPGKPLEILFQPFHVDSHYGDDKLKVGLVIFPPYVAVESKFPQNGLAPFNG